MSIPVDTVRTFALIGHGGAGKTSLAETLLFDAKATKRLGKVDNGSSVLDYEPEEVARQISISAAFHDLTWKKHHFYLIDTPGDDNFLNDAKASLQASDAAVLVADAMDGVKIQGERAFEFATEFNLPKLAVINKLDRERANFEAALESMSTALGVDAVPVALPIGLEAGFKGMVDLLSGKAYTFADDESGNMTEGPVPDDMTEAVAEAKEKLIEHIAEADDSLLERYLEGETLKPEEIAAGLRAAVLAGTFLPVLPYSAAKNMGAPLLLNLIKDTLPSPVDRGSAKATGPGGEELEIAPNPEDPFVGLVFKTVADPYAGRLSIIRIFSGRLSGDMGVYNASKETKERFGGLFAPQGKSQGSIEDSAGPGAIVAVSKLKETVTGDTLCADKPGVLLPRVEPLPAVISYAIEPKEKGDEEKVFAGLTRIIEEDETLKLTRDAQTKDMILWGMGQVHLEVALEKLKRKFGGEVILKTPKVPYLETIKKKVTDIQGKYKKQSGGRGQYGDAVVNMEPTARGEGFIFEDKIVGGVIPRQYIPAVEKGIVERSVQGVLAGYPMIDFRVQLIFGSYHSVDSSEMAFKVAGSLAFQKAAAAAQPTILEPIMALEVIIPEDAMGDVIGDLNSRRGKVLGMDSKGTNQIIKALVPMAEVLQYAPDLKSMTGARGSFTITQDHYEEVPAQLQEKIIAEAKAETE